MINLTDKVTAAFNRLAKWRSVFAGWQLGTRADDDAECRAVRDHREVTMMLRAEVNALTAIILRANVCTQEELQEQMLEEAEFLSKAYERKFPGFKATDYGMDMNIEIARDTMQGWRP
jgi:hypothetical protein